MGADPANDSENVGPPHAELESELFRSEFHNVQGDLFKDILKSEVTTIGPKSGSCPEPVKSFADMPLHWLLKQNLQVSERNGPQYKCNTDLTARRLD